MEFEFQNLLCKARRGEEVLYSFSEEREKFFLVSETLLSIMLWKNLV